MSTLLRTCILTLPTYVMPDAHFAVSAGMRGRWGIHDVPRGSTCLCKPTYDRNNKREFHIVGGHNEHVPFDYYLDTISILKKNYPQGNS